MMNSTVQPLATVAILWLGLASQVVAAPTVFWASDPVLPGQTVVVIGDPPKGDAAAMFLGCLDEIKVWTRALSEGDIRAEYTAHRLAK